MNPKVIGLFYMMLYPILTQSMDQEFHTRECIKYFKTFTMQPESTLQIIGQKENITVIVVPEIEKKLPPESGFKQLEIVKKITSLISTPSPTHEKVLNESVKIIYSSMPTKNLTPFTQSKDKNGNVIIKTDQQATVYSCLITIPPNIDLNVKSNGNINFETLRASITAQSKQVFMPQFNKKKKFNQEVTIRPATCVIENDQKGEENTDPFMPHISLETSDGTIFVTILRK